MNNLARQMADLADLFDTFLERAQQLTNVGKVQLYEELLEEIAEINQRILEVLVCAPSEQINRYTALIGAEIKFFRALHRDLDQAVP